MNEEEKQVDERKVTLAARQLGSMSMWHDSHEAEHGDMVQILAEYGILDRFNRNELQILRRELGKRARAAEEREAERWARRAEEREVAPEWLPDRPAPSPRTLELMHRTWKEAMKKRNGRTAKQANQAFIGTITNCEVA